MTISTTTRRAILAGAISAAGLTAIAVPGTAHAAPRAVAPFVAVAPPAVTPIGPDPLAAPANVALDALDRWLATGDDAALDVYERRRAELAEGVGARLDIDPERLLAAWMAADFDHQQALMAAMTQLGVPYRRNTSRPGEGFDCSGLTTFAWNEAGFTLPRQSTAQIRRAAKRTKDTAQAGDLVQYPGHVMMWLGVDRAIIHAIGRGRTVELDTTSRRSVRFGDPTG